MLNALKAATQAQHDRLELRLNLFDRLHDVSSYLRYLERLMGYYDPLEKQILSIPVESTGLDIHARLKTPWIEQDLFALADFHTTPLSLVPRCTDLPTLHTTSQVLGCLYVIEGATLGGQIIMRYVETVLGITAQTGGRFFTGYGTGTPGQWSAFREAVYSYVACRPEEKGLILTAAKDTFRTFERWLCDNPIQSEYASPPCDSHAEE